MFLIRCSYVNSRSQFIKILVLILQLVGIKTLQKKRAQQDGVIKIVPVKS